ncbi:hypothetical protein ACFLVY_00300 [Chloroflexota bacterium]
MIGSMIKAIRHKAKSEQRGYVYILILFFLVIGALMIPPLLEFVSTGLKSGPIFEQKTDEIYACDAGVDDAIWQIKYEGLPTMFPAYDEYDYASVWSYPLGENVNDETVAVTIQNRWIPKDIPPPTPSEARDYIDGTDEAGCRIRVNGSATAFSEYRIRIDIIPEEPWVLNVESIGVWLPSGFSYVDGSSNLEYLGYSVDVDSYAGGEAVVWDLGSTVFADLPGPQETAIVEFEYTSETERELVTISWIETQNVGPAGVQIPISWDDDTKVFGITSSASGGTTVESNVYLSARYSSLLDNAITSPGSTDMQPDTTVNGIIECPPDGFDEPSDGYWEWQDYDEEWPDTEQWRQHFEDDVAGAPDPGSPVDIKDYDEDNPLGPWYRSGDLKIRCSDDTENALLGGTIYVTGDLDFEQPGTPKAYTLDLNWQTIFVEGGIYFAPDNITLTGSGCIIAIGDINFQPNVTSNPGDFIFVCSLEGTVNFNPNGDYFGSVAGQEVVGMQPGSSITWTSPPGGLNLPGMGGSGTGGFGSNITKYTWKID